MPVLDFKEIPKAHESNGLQDTFELFARDFLEFMGYHVITDPDRGADGGVDLVVEERRTGVGGETVIRWLVSCKHKAFSGNSVTFSDDNNIRDRVDANSCHGFIGFYSTLASSGLSNSLKGLRNLIEYQIFDKEKIENQLLHTSRGIELAERYFPKSLLSWKVENPEPARLFINDSTLKCEICKKELLVKNNYEGIVVFYSKERTDFIEEKEHYEYIHWVCKGNCDNELKHKISQYNNDAVESGWEDISDVIMPTIFIRWIFATLNEQRNGKTHSDEAFENFKEFLIQIFPYVSRHLTSKEQERIKMLSMIPSYLGGLGYED